MESLPFEPEDMPQIKARFLDALREDHDIPGSLVDPSKSIAFDRKHVFDFPDGIRLTASIDHAPGYRVLHLSFRPVFNYQREEELWGRIAELIAEFVPGKQLLMQFPSPLTDLRHFFFLP